MYRTIKFQFKNSDSNLKTIFGYLTYHATKLWNYANYMLYNKLVGFHVYDLYNKIRVEEKQLNSMCLHSKSCQILFRELLHGWYNFFEWNKNRELYASKGIQYVAPPKYRKNRNHSTVTYDATGFKISGTKIYLSITDTLRKHLKEKHGIIVKRGYGIEIDTGIDLSQYDIKYVKVVPYERYNHVTYEIHITYKIQNESVNPVTDSNRTMAIDFGYKNVAMVVIEGVSTPFNIDGRKFKSLVRKHLKSIAKLQSKLSKLKQKLQNVENTIQQKKLEFQVKRIEKKLHNRWLKVRNTINDFAHKVSSKLQQLALKHNVKYIVFGGFHEKLDQFKIELPKTVTEILKMIPFGKIVDLTKYKCGAHNIVVETIDESYTSMTDSLDPNCFPSKDSFSNGKSKRIFRGIFQTIIRKLHADVNACRNILRKFKVTILNIRNYFETISGLGTIQRVFLYK